MVSNFRWGRRSSEIRAELAAPLKWLADEVIAHSPFDISLTSGFREERAQNEAFELGFSRLRWPESKHNTMPSHAMHLDPYPVNYENSKLYYVLAGVVLSRAMSMRMTIRWGGDWDMDYDLTDQTFNDLAHWEIEQ